MSAQAFVDESGRGSNYHVCAAVVAHGDVDVVRRVSRGLCMRGQRRWHFVSERDSRRRQIIDTIVATGQVSALAYYGKGAETEIRSESFRRLVGDLIERKVTRLVIESRAGRDEQDRRVLVEQLHRRPGHLLSYHHLAPHEDPLLWVADAIAWCSSAGGRWRERISPITAHERITLP